MCNADRVYEKILLMDETRKQNNIPPKEEMMSVKEQREIKIAFAKSVVEQIRALNRSLAQADRIGLRIDLEFHGYDRLTPEITAIYDRRGNVVTWLNDSVFHSNPPTDEAEK